ncbi:glycosyltransferase family A protein [Flavihumibacter sp. ZG627]|uniref:glycosyltransferase family 2 protein n=1 Tax=Flavihumibacter sp. ZG627 TaxID=1463156 RepID=UPI0005807150|nr:glycosyltransferase family A protein [Flavihumibacter sp. ZG627]KIC92306.1 hypothetical protein HY58_01845 [Flavihumibacter sp. ZG627]
MLFSILIAHYNNAKFLENCLQSVINQSSNDWEIILVDDGSTDHFEEVIESYSHLDKLHVYRNECNMGCGYTKWRCASLANGEILGFLDPDDALEPEAIEIMSRLHHENPGCSLIHSSHYVCDSDMRKRRVSEYTRAIPENSSYLLLSDGRVHHFASFKSSCYKNTEGISREIQKAVDMDMYYKLEETGNIKFVDKPLYQYRIHKGGISTMGKEAEANRWHYDIIEAACRRRIAQLLYQSVPDKVLLKKYKARYYKIRIINSFRKKEWRKTAFSILPFFLHGGFPNFISYMGKLVRSGPAVLKRTFHYNHEIKV